MFVWLFGCLSVYLFVVAVVDDDVVVVDCCLSCVACLLFVACCGCLTGPPKGHLQWKTRL